MDAELLELQRQFEYAQQAKSSVRLSERNIVELILKLQELRFIDFDLLHTVSGKEYITTEQLQFEMVAEIRRLGRVSLIDLSDALGVDLYHIEKQGQQIVASDHGLMLLNGEIISESYWDGVAEEINEKLQECSQIFLAEIAAQLHVGSEIVMSVLEPRLGTIIKGRLEGGQLFTPAYVSRITAMVRGAARGITIPTNLPTVWSSLLHLSHDINDGIGVSIENTLFHSIFNALVKGKEILGSLRAGGQWTPTVFAHAQRESVDSFFSQVILHKHLLETLAAPIVDKFIQTLVMDNKLKNGIKIEDGENFDAEHLTSANRISLAKSLPDSLSAKVQAVVEALKGKHVGTFMAAFQDLAEESGLLLKKLDNKLEKSLLQSYGKDLTSQISSETDPLVLLPKILAVLYLQVYNKALQTPRKPVSALISRLKDKLPEEAFKVLMDYHSATVTLLALQAAATEDEEDCTADRILSKKEYLESKMPELKGLVLKSSNSEN